MRARPQPESQSSYRPRGGTPPSATHGRKRQGLPLRARQPRGTATRAAILHAAERIFAESGLAGARTGVIAEKAGVNKALLYYYFEGKDSLFRAVLEDHFKEFQRRALGVLSGTGPAQDTLLRYVGTHFDFISARRYYPSLFQRLMLTGGRSLERLAKKYFAPLSQKLVEVIERGIREGELRPADSHHTAISLVALTVFYFSAAPIVKVVARMDPYEEGNLARRREEVLNFIRHGLFRNPETSAP